MYRTPRSQPWVHACHVKGGFKKPAGKVLSHAFTLRAETEVCTIILYYTTQLESNKVSDTWIFWKLLNSRVDFNPRRASVEEHTEKWVGQEKGWKKDAQCVIFAIWPYAVKIYVPCPPLSDTTLLTQSIWFSFSDSLPTKYYTGKMCGCD